MTPVLTPASRPAGAGGRPRLNSSATRDLAPGVPHPVAVRTGGGRVRLASAVVLASACGLLAACGTTPGPGAAPTKTVTVEASPAAPAATTQPAASAPAPPAGPPTCLANGLQASLGAGQGAAGTYYQVLDLTNTSAATCSLYGYPGVSFVTGVGGSTVGAPANHNPVDPRTLVTLAPGGQANALIVLHAAGAYPPSDCQMTNVSWLRIYPPGDYGSVYVQYPEQYCANATEQIMTVTPIRAGAGSAAP
jgi:Protein of unknown function (DUF4232)